MLQGIHSHAHYWTLLDIVSVGGRDLEREKDVVFMCNGVLLIWKDEWKRRALLVLTPRLIMCFLF